MKPIKSYLKKIHLPKKNSHKGENGKLLIIGGSKDYHGAPIFSIKAARNFVDLVYFYPGEKDQFLISAVKSIPEVIVLRKWKRTLNPYDAILFGIGLSETKFPYLSDILKHKKLVIDGDGLKNIKKNIPNDSILTPHEGEFRYLFGLKGTEENVKKMAKEYSCTILKKGTPDIISDGERIIKNNTHNQGMTKGGTGDILSSLVAALYTTNPAFHSAVAGAYICGFAGNLLKRRFLFFYSAGDLAEEIKRAAALIFKSHF